MADRKTSQTLDRPGPSDLPSLLERLAEDLANLLDQKLTLLKVEIKEEIDAYVRGGIIILAGGIVAAIGFALTNIALAFAISTFFANTNLSQGGKYALGFVVTGILYLIIGSLAILIVKNRLAKQGIIPRRTVKELERDKEWLQKEI
jgi:uncharacterized membrane protein YqjE